MNVGPWGTSRMPGRPAPADSGLNISQGLEHPAKQVQHGWCGRRAHASREREQPPRCPACVGSLWLCQRHLTAHRPSHAWPPDTDFCPASGHRLPQAPRPGKALHWPDLLWSTCPWPCPRLSEEGLGSRPSPAIQRRCTALGGRVPLTATLQSPPVEQTRIPLTTGGGRLWGRCWGVCVAYLDLPRGQGEVEAGWVMLVGEVWSAKAGRGGAWRSLPLALRGVLPCSYRHK